MYEMSANVRELIQTQHSFRIAVTGVPEGKYLDTLQGYFSLSRNVELFPYVIIFRRRIFHALRRFKISVPASPKKHYPNRTVDNKGSIRALLCPPNQAGSQAWIR